MQVCIFYLLVFPLNHDGYRNISHFQFFSCFFQAIQSSLSSSSLANNPSYATEPGQTINKKEVGMIVQLKRELEEKEKFTQR